MRDTPIDEAHDTPKGEIRKCDLDEMHVRRHDLLSETDDSPALQHICDILHDKRPILGDLEYGAVIHRVEVNVKDLWPIG